MSCRSSKTCSQLYNCTRKTSHKWMNEKLHLLLLRMYNLVIALWHSQPLKEVRKASCQTHCNHCFIALLGFVDFCYRPKVQPDNFVKICYTRCLKEIVGEKQKASTLNSTGNRYSKKRSVLIYLNFSVKQTVKHLNSAALSRTGSHKDESNKQGVQGGALNTLYFGLY